MIWKLFFGFCYFHVSYFDCTNFYFDIGRSDMDTFDDNGNPIDKKGNPTELKYRKQEPEKNHRPDPIVKMGLLMGKNGIPLAFDLFPGNESEKVHMRPIINRVKNEFNSGRIIFVADRGLNTSDNIYFLNGDNKGDYNPRDGYVYGQLVRGADAGSGAYVRNIAFDKATGEIVEGRELTLDTEKITEEEKYDGYYSVVTSELNMSDYEIRDTYRGLARIEEPFKISKTEFESRPVFVWTNEHIPVRLL